MRSRMPLCCAAGSQTRNCSEYSWYVPVGLMLMQIRSDALPILEDCTRIGGLSTSACLLMYSLLRFPFLRSLLILLLLLLNPTLSLVSLAVNSLKFESAFLAVYASLCLAEMPPELSSKEASLAATEKAVKIMDVSALFSGRVCLIVSVSSSMWHLCSIERAFQCLQCTVPLFCSANVLLQYPTFSTRMK